MTDPRITKALDMLDFMPFATDVPKLVAVLREVARVLDEQEEWLRTEITTDDGFAETIGLTVIRYAREALAPLAELGGSATCNCDPLDDGSWTHHPTCPLAQLGGSDD